MRARRVAGLVGAALVAAGLPSLAATNSGASAVSNVSRTADLAEGEQFVAVNPRNPANVIVGSNQFVPIAGPNDVPVSRRGLVNCAVWSSHDGGRTWRGGPMSAPGTVPDLATIDPQQIHGADQNIVFDRRGTAWYQCQHLSIDPPAFTIFVWRSADGGRTWSAPVPAVRAPGELFQHDRPFLAIDQSGGSRDGTLYLSWQSMLYEFWAPAVYVRSSRDGGRTWSAVTRVDEVGPDRAMWNPRQMPSVGGDGTLYIAYASSINATPYRDDPEATHIGLVVARSTDGGATFTRHRVENTVNRIDSPDEGSPEYAEMISSIAADPRRAGRVAVAWPDDRSGEARILLRHSVDGGRRWSAILDVAADRHGTGNQHDHVATGYLPDGRLLVVWRDRRASGGGWDAPFHIYGRVVSIDRAGRARLGREIRLTTKPAAPTTGSRGVMPSEYLGLAVGRDGVSIAWDELVGSIGDNFFRRVPLTAFR